MIIGIDLDNTIVNYDALFHRAGLHLGLIPSRVPASKQAIRDHVRTSHGDEAWQELQAEVYGPRMGEAEQIAGVDRFLRRAAACRAKVFIVSHKTEYAGMDRTRTNLREAAFSWLERQGFFRDQGFGLDRDDIHFESTRAGKIARVLDLGCQTFIDDLEEVLGDPALAGRVARILYAPHQDRGGDLNESIRRFGHWDEITAYVFG